MVRDKGLPSHFDESGGNIMTISLSSWKQNAHVCMIVVIVMRMLALETPIPAHAHHRDFGDGECSWFPDTILPLYDFHGACTNHDRCGERAGSNKLAWDKCDTQLKIDAEKSCFARHRHASWNLTARLLQGECLKMADAMYRGLRKVISLPWIHRN